MPRKSQFNKEQQLDIIKLYNEGKSTVKLAEMFNSKASTIASMLKTNGIELRSNKINSRKFYCNENYFHEIDTEDKAYWLGFIYADGYITINNRRKQFGLALAIKDRSHIEKLNNCLESTYKIHNYTVSAGYGEGNMYSRLIIDSERIVDDLQSHGVYANKALILEPPVLREDLVRHFIRGYIDGDGSISRTFTCAGYKYSLKIVGTDAILNYIKEFIENNTNRKINKFYKRNNDDEVSYISINGNVQLIVILDQIYGNSSIYLDRKHERYLNLNGKTQSSLVETQGVKSLELLESP